MKQHWTFTEKAMKASSVAQDSYSKDGHVSLIWNSRRNHSCYFFKLFEKYITVIVFRKIVVMFEVFNKMLIKTSERYQIILPLDIFQVSLWFLRRPRQFFPHLAVTGSVEIWLLNFVDWAVGLKNIISPSGWYQSLFEGASRQCCKLSITSTKTEQKSSF